MRTELRQLAVIRMVKRSKLCSDIQKIIAHPEAAHRIEEIDAAVRLYTSTFGFSEKFGKRSKKRSVVCRQINEVGRLSDELYMAYRYCRHINVARALCLLIQLFRSITLRAGCGNSELRLPKVLMDKKKRRLAAWAPKIRARLLNAGVELKLVELLIIPIDRFLTRHAFMYGDLAFIQMHRKVLMSLDLAHVDPEAIRRNIFSGMLQIDFNNLQYIDYCIADYRQSLESFGNDVSAKRRYIGIQKRKLKAVVYNGKYCYDYRYNSLKKHLLLWLDEEKAYLSDSSVKVLQSSSSV